MKSLFLFPNLNFGKTFPNLYYNNSTRKTVMDSLTCVCGGISISEFLPDLNLIRWKQKLMAFMGKTSCHYWSVISTLIFAEYIQWNATNWFTAIQTKRRNLVVTVWWFIQVLTLVCISYANRLRKAYCTVFYT